jgi:hypothetical protein
MNSGTQLPASGGIFRKGWVVVLVLAAMCAGGLALRFTNLTNPPLDVHGWRQLRSAILARDYYYQSLPDIDPILRQQAHAFASSLQVLEPPIFERLVALTYTVIGGEKLWVARVYSILFWMVGGLVLFFIVRRLVSVSGAFISLAYFLFLPFANTHSRIFMPEPLMILLILLALAASVMWIEQRNWLWAILTGLFAGLAILIKVFAVYFVFPAICSYLLVSWGGRKVFHNRQTYLVLGLSAVIPAIYYFVLNPGSSGNYLQTWTLPYLHLLLQPTFYIAWVHRLGGLLNPVLLITAILGITMLPNKARLMAGGLWMGYVLLGFSVPSLIRSHIYYNLVLVPIAAISLAALGERIYLLITSQNKFWQAVFWVVVIIGLGDAALVARKDLTQPEYHGEPAFWQQLSTELPADGNYIGLTEDYNTRLMYYGWRYVSPYPYSFDQDMVILAGKSFDVSQGNWKYFLDKTRNQRYFIVTMLDEFESQPYLKTILYGYYPVVVQGERFVVFDLMNPVNPLPVSIP